MTDLNGKTPENTQEAKLPRRDWILLPMLGLLTVVFMTLSTEVIARRVYTEQKVNWHNCLITGDSSTVVRGIPNSRCSEQSFEAGRVEYKLNGSGYRAGMEPLPKPPGTYRIVMAGSSLAFGDFVPMEKTIATLLPADLSQLTKRKVQLYNEGMMIGFPRSVCLRFNDVLMAKPDMILWLLSPWDIEHPARIAFDDEAPASLLSEVRETVKSSRTRILLEYILYRRPNSALKLKLVAAGGPGFLRAKTTPELQQHLQQLDADATDIEGRARAAGVPFAAVLVPSRPQAAMISAGVWPAGYDPYRLGDDLRSIIERNGGIYIDILPDFRDVPRAEEHYLPTLAHPDVDGHAIISKMIAKELASVGLPRLGDVAPPLQAAVLSQPTQVRER